MNKHKVYRCPKKAILESNSGFAEFFAKKTFDIPLWFRVCGGADNKYWLLWWVENKRWCNYPKVLSYTELLSFTDAEYYSPVGVHRDFRIEEAPAIPMPEAFLEIVE